MSGRKHSNGNKNVRKSREKILFEKAQNAPQKHIENPSSD